MATSNNKELTYDLIPRELKETPQWICWRSERGKDQKTNKVPYAPRTKTNWKWGDSNTHLSHEEALDIYQNYLKGYGGIGFVLTDYDNLVAIDLDDAFEISQAGEKILKQYAQDLVNEAQSWAEVSQSGNGIHVLIKGKITKAIKRKEIEVYPRGRFIAMTGWQLGEITTISNAQPLLDRFAQKYSNSSDKNYHNNDSPPPKLDKDDSIIIEQLKLNQKFRTLFFDGETSLYPSRSEAVMALLCIFVTQGCGDKQIYRLFQQSKLHTGAWIKKWERRSQEEIEKARAFAGTDDIEMPPKTFNELMETARSIESSQDFKSFDDLARECAKSKLSKHQQNEIARFLKRKLKINIGDFHDRVRTFWKQSNNIRDDLNRQLAEEWIEEKENETPIYAQKDVRLWRDNVGRLSQKMPLDKVYSERYRKLRTFQSPAQIPL